MNIVRNTLQEINSSLQILIFQVFFKADTTSENVGNTELETELCLLLKEMDGVGEVNVMIYEGEKGVEGVVVVCDGANDLQVNMNIREAIAAALGANEKNIKIYLKK
jgi:hypothetical protein